MAKIEDLEKEVELIKQRNKRVETEKAGKRVGPEE